jgi:hypothetical protein
VLLETLNLMIFNVAFWVEFLSQKHGEGELFFFVAFLAVVIPYFYIVFKRLVVFTWGMVSNSTVQERTY